MVLLGNVVLFVCFQIPSWVERILKKQRFIWGVKHVFHTSESGTSSFSPSQTPAAGRNGGQKISYNRRASKSLEHPPYGYGVCRNCSTTANTWLDSRAGPLTGLSVAGASSLLGAPRSRGTASTAQSRTSSSNGSRRRVPRGPEGGMAVWSVGDGGLDNA